MGPAPSSAQELHDKAGVLYHQYLSERFLEFARQYLGYEIGTEALEEIRQVAERRAAYGEEEEEEEEAITAYYAPQLWNELIELPSKYKTTSLQAD